MSARGFSSPKKRSKAAESAAAQHRALVLEYQKVKAAADLESQNVPQEDPKVLEEVERVVTDFSTRLRDALLVHKTVNLDSFFLDYLNYALTSLTRRHNDIKMAAHPKVLKWALTIAFYGNSKTYDAIRGGGWKTEENNWIGMLPLPSERTIRNVFSGSRAMPGLDVAQIKVLIRRLNLQA